MNCRKLYLVAFACFLIFYFHYAESTEVTVGSSTIDKSLGMTIKLPVLVCHVRHAEYKQVTWYKDGATGETIQIKKGSNDLSSHMLSLSSLLNSSSSPSVYDHPLKLQGYYWCRTDHTDSSTIHKYLFQIKEVNTFVGKFVATNDSLGEDEHLKLQDKLNSKMEIYEQEMETELFVFLPSPSVYVTHMKMNKDGLHVRFFLYVRRIFHPRKPIDDELEADEHHYLYVKEYLTNETSDVDPAVFYLVRDWMDLLGIDVNSIDLRSTLGCYKEEYKMPSNIPGEEVKWPSARIGEIVIPDNACSSKNGLAVTRMCTGSFNTGAIWGNPSDDCGKAAEGITLEMKKLYDEFGRVKRPLYIQKLAKLMEDSSYLGVTDLHIVTDILKALSLQPKLNQQEISGVLSLVDKIVKANTTELIAAKQNIRLTSRILQVLDNLVSSASKEGIEIQISKEHLMVDTKYTTSHENDVILGLAVIAPSMPNTLHDGSIEFVTSKSKLPIRNSIAYFALPLQLIHDRESTLKSPCQINMVFFKEWYLFQNPKGTLLKRNYKVLPTPVMNVSLSGGPAWNLTDPVQLYFKDTLEEEVENPVCVYYDPRQEDGAGAWSPEGCEYKGLKNGYYHCQCHHLSIFAVILSRNPGTSKENEYKLGVSVYVASGISMLGLSLAVLLFILSKSWRQTVDHSILFCTSLTFLACVIIIFISEIVYFTRKKSCLALALLLQYTIFSIFGWLCVHALIYRLRFAKKTDVSEIPHLMIKASLAVWGIPIVMVFIMWFSREYPPAKDGCWTIICEVSKEAVIPVAVLILITLSINVCATYSLTCHFKKDFLIGDSSYNDVALKFRVAFTIFFFFVLSWLFGLFALHKKTQTLTILFSISITLTAYYVTLFFIFQEISFWELCHCCKQKEETDELPPVQYKAKSYNTVEESKEAEK